MEGIPLDTMVELPALNGVQKVPIALRRHAPDLVHGEDATRQHFDVTGPAHDRVVGAADIVPGCGGGCTGGCSRHAGPGQDAGWRAPTPRPCGS